MGLDLPVFQQNCFNFVERWCELFRKRRGVHSSSRPIAFGGSRLTRKGALDLTHANWTIADERLGTQESTQTAHRFHRGSRRQSGRDGNSPPTPKNSSRVSEHVRVAAHRRRSRRLMGCCKRHKTKGNTQGCPIFDLFWNQQFAHRSQPTVCGLRHSRPTHSGG